MSTILLSINPVHVNNILTGKKQYEFRKRACKRKVDKIIIYSTTPVMKVVGEADVEQVLIDKPSKVWSIIKSKSGIDNCFFDAYYKDRGEAVAYKLTNIVEYREPKDLKDYGIEYPPQSYQYIEGGPLC